MYFERKLPIGGRTGEFMSTIRLGLASETPGVPIVDSFCKGCRVLLGVFLFVSWPHTRPGGGEAVTCLRAGAINELPRN